MKKQLTVLLVLLAFVPCAWGQVTTTFATAGSITGAEKIYAPLSGIDQNITTAQFKAYCLAGFAPAWSSLTGVPTTLGGYGITDAGNGVTSESVAAASVVTLASRGRVSFDAITLGAGSGAYVVSRALSDTGARAGDEWFLNVSWPASTNPTLAFFDGSTGGTALGSYAGSANAGSSTLQFVFNGTAWTHYSKGEVPARTLGTGVMTALQAPLDGANGLWALNSSGNFPSFTLDPSATFTIPSGGTLINNGTLVTTLKQRYFATTTLEQAYVLAQGELGEAGDTGLLYLGDGTTAGGHLANMGVLPTSGTTVSTTYSGQTTTSAGATGGSVYYTAGGSSGYGYTGGPGYFQGGAGNGNFTQSGPAYLDAGPYSSVGPGQGNSANVGTLQNTTSVNIGRSNIITTITGGLSLGSASLQTFPPFIFSDTPTVVTATSGTIIARNTSVIANNTSQVVLTPDYNQPVGSIVRVYGLGSGGWKIAQNAAGEQIIASGHATTAGTSGYLASGTANDSVVLVCLVLHTTWEVIGGTGTYTFN